MFTDLLETRAPRGRTRRARARVAAASVAAHAVAITIAAAATAPRPHAPPARLVATPVVFTETPPTPPTPPTRRAGGRPGAPGAAPTSPRSTPPATPAPLGPIDVVTAPTDPATVAGPDDGLGAAPPTGAPGGASAPVPDGVYRVAERAAAPLPGAPAARYPEELRRAGIEGEALLRFVVDSAGAVEPGSVAVLRATHPRFADAARRALLAMRFAPAEAGGRRVRQLVEQAFTFAIGR